MAEATPTMVFVYGTLKRGFPNHPLLVASSSPFVGAASTAGPASLVIGPYSVPFLLPPPSSASSGRVVSGELYAPSPAALAELDDLEGTHIGVYERRPITVVADGSGEAVQAEAYFAHPSYAEALWRRCGGEAAEIGEYTVDHAGRYVPKSERAAEAAGLIDAIHRWTSAPVTGGLDGEIPSHDDFPETTAKQGEGRKEGRKGIAMAASPQQQGQGGPGGGGGGWTPEQFWSLLDKADRRFARVRDLSPLGRQEPDAFAKAFRAYTQLWRMQQEHRHRLLEAGLRRWQVGEIAARIAHLYYAQYQRTADTALLSEAFVFYHAVLDRAYFQDADHHLSPAKHLRFLARFLLVALLLARRSHTVPRLASDIRTLLDDSKKSFQDAEYKEWKHVVQEIARFLRADSPFMNMRPLRYSYAFDPPPDTLRTVPPTVKKRGLVLSDTILCSYYPNEVKFTDLSIDVFRMVQCLEWEPCGSFALNNGYSAHDESGQNQPNLLKDLRDAALPPNPLKTILYRPSMTHFLTVLATKCEELPSNGIMLIYLSATGEMGTSGFCPDTGEKVLSNFNKFDISSTSHISSKENKEPCLWLGCRETEGSNCIYPGDLIPFTRRPLFLVIDSSTSYAFKSIHGTERGETAAMLLSPSSRSSAAGFSGDSTRNCGSQFTMFLTAPLQAFCFLIGNNGTDIDRDAYNKAEELLLLSLNEWAMTLVASSSLHPVWVEVLGDPLLRRLLLRFIFCRATHSLFKPTNHKAEFLPTCMPPLPESVDAESMLSQSCVMRVASFFGAVSQFSFAEVTTWPDVDPEEAVATSSSGSANKGVPETARDSDISNSSSSF